MRKILTSIFLLFLVLSCGSDQWDVLFSIRGWPICAPMNLEEREILEETIIGFHKVLRRPWIPPDCLIVIRNMNDEIPKMCDNPGCLTRDCVNRWSDLDNILGPQPDDPEIGYGGYNGHGYVFVSRIGGQRVKYKGLLIHEYAHSLGYIKHGGEMLRFERLVAAEVNW